MTIGEVLAEGTLLLRRHSIDTPSLDASLMLARVLRIDRSRLIMRSPEALSPEARTAFLALLERRIAGEPAAYILRSKEFRYIDLEVNPGVLIPRPDTEILVEAALEEIDSAGKETLKLLDLCTGSGAVGIALKNERPEIELSLSDISPDALETARRNAERILGKGTFRIYEGDLFARIPGSFHIIVSNPPYIPQADMANLPPEVLREPALALNGGAGGLDIIRDIIVSGKNKLLPGGRLFLEADPRQMGEIKGILEENGYRRIRVYRDLAGLERVIGASIP